MRTILVIGISYIIGSFSSAFVLGRVLKKEDIRNYGSGNSGATNALRVFGKGIGILAFVLDVLKGIIAVYIGGKIIGYNGKLIGGFFAVIGHNWPLFFSFKGGKGIATSFGVLLSLNWLIGVISFTFFVIVVAISKYMSLGSILSAIIVPILGLLMNKPFDNKYFVTTLALAILALCRHRANIKRLIQGEEFKIGQKVK